MNPETLRAYASNLKTGARPVVDIVDRLLAAADAWELDLAIHKSFVEHHEATDEVLADLRKSYEVLCGGIRSLWHGVVDGDMDKLSVGYALKELMR
jgi:hypothetical protein